MCNTFNSDGKDSWHEHEHPHHCHLSISDYESSFDDLMFFLLSSGGLAARVRDSILPTASDLDVHVFGDVLAFFWFVPLLEFFPEGHTPLYSSTKSL